MSKDPFGDVLEERGRYIVLSNKGDTFKGQLVNATRCVMSYMKEPRLHKDGSPVIGISCTFLNTRGVNKVYESDSPIFIREMRRLFTENGSAFGFWVEIIKTSEKGKKRDFLIKKIDPLPIEAAPEPLPEDEFSGDPEDVPF
jgi:hypothetical protein